MKALKDVTFKYPCSVIFIMSFFLFAALQYRPAVLNYTTRFVDFAHYMFQNGLTLFPISDDLQPYPDYTVTHTFLVYLISLPFGQVSLLSLATPFCIAAALTLVFYTSWVNDRKRNGAHMVLCSRYSPGHFWTA
ncbi:hypothetical protein [Pseudomonas fragi]|uniref:hypothetical protein n=1 Tax=Pseudomonas fragi TaxID=296 RepID=UPI002952B082|nr:hypothetical protein [Pseudomonas fragi]WOL27266.1 hypothetical protein Q1A94_20320 [Pseudomonas fragi]